MDRTSPPEPGAIARKASNSLVVTRSNPSAMLLETDSAARSSWLRKPGVSGTPGSSRRSRTRLWSRAASFQIGSSSNWCTWPCGILLSIDVGWLLLGYWLAIAWLLAIAYWRLLIGRRAHRHSLYPRPHFPEKPKARCRPSRIVSGFFNKLNGHPLGVGQKENGPPAQTRSRPITVRSLFPVKRLRGGAARPGSVEPTAH